MRFLADENFNNRVLAGLRIALPDIDVIRVQDSEIYGFPDPAVLNWAAINGRIILTHDVQTMTKYAYERIEAGLPMPGVIEVDSDLPIGAGTVDDFENQVKYVPLH
jgi:hypothetical protein